jgi:hypothetical protein
MRVVPGLLVLGFSFAMNMTPAFASAFDGKWIADIPPQGRCNGTSTMTLVIAGGTIAGQVHNPGRSGVVSGTVDQDGHANFMVNGKFPGTMNFTHDHFEANWFNGACDRHAEGDRERDPAQNAAIVDTRKQYQDKFDDLVKRAQAGDKNVDYTALRAAYVYTENWDYFGNKTIPLLQQAQVAQKGGDCITGMNKLDDVIRFDFTVDSAHSLLSDCLEDNDRAKAKIESAIAYGLVNSLMDSGDGDSEKTAYVVSTQREEMDVLANRHVQLKTRQTQVRGSDGHYYDQVQGISLRGGGASVKTIYFNVDSFVAGRESKRAAIEVAASSIH